MTGPSRQPTGRRVADLLEADRGWLTTGGVAMEGEERFGVGELDAVRQALHRLKRAGKVSSRRLSDAAFGVSDVGELVEWKWVP